MKPWSPPEARLYPVLDDLLEDWEADSAARLAEPGLRLVGHRFSAEAHATRDFVARNGVPYRWLDIADPEARRLMAAAGLDDTQLPGARLRGRRDAGAALPGRDRRAGSACARRRSSPSTTSSSSAAARPGWRRRSTERPRACARSWSSAMRRAGRRARARGSRTTSGSRPALSGADLARRATAQARRLGAEMLTAREVLAIRENGPSRVVTLDGGEEIGCHSVLVATGVHYSRLEAPGVEAPHRLGRLLRRGARRGRGRRGRGRRRRGRGELRRAGGRRPRRAGRAGWRCSAAPTGSRRACPTTWSSGSARWPNVEVDDARGGHGGLRGRPARGAHGRRGRDGRSACPATAAFVFIGARPQTDWLGDAVARDAAGFIVSGAGGAADRGTAPLARWSATPSRSRPACPASSWPVTCATSRSSAWRRPSARARWRCSSCTSTSAACSRRRRDDRRPPARRCRSWTSLGDEELARARRGRARAPPRRRVSSSSARATAPAAFHVVLDGQLETTREVAGEQVLMISHGPGGFLGAMALLTDTPYRGTTCAVAETVLFELDGEELRRLAFTHPAAAARVPAGDRVGERRDQGHRARPREAARGRQARRRAGARAEQPRRRRRPGRRDAARVRAAATGRLRRDRRAPAPRRSSSAALASLGAEATEQTVPGERLDPLAASDREQELVETLDAARRPRRLRDRVRAHRRRGSGPSGSIASPPESATTASPPACASSGPAPARASCWPSWRRRRRASPTSSAPSGATRTSTRRRARPSTSTRGSRARSRSWRHKLRAKRIEIVRDLDPELPGVEASGSELNQVWTNLIDNAIDAVGPGGRITLRTRRQGERVLRRDRRRRAGDPRRPAGAHLRRLLHHQARRPGHRPRARHRPAHRGPPPRRAAPASPSPGTPASRCCCPSSERHLPGTTRRSRFRRVVRGWAYEAFRSTTPWGSKS